MTDDLVEFWVDAGAAGVKRMAEENARLREVLREIGANLVPSIDHERPLEHSCCATAEAMSAKASAALAPKEGA